MFKNAIVIVLLFVVACACAMPAAAQRNYTHPTWVISRMAKAPTIDGTINPDEYADASTLTGMVNHIGGGLSLVAQIQDVHWYVGYDDKFLYIAIRSPQRPGTWPRAQCKISDGGDVYWDDHVEIQIATKGRFNAAKEGYGFYKVTANARGIVTDDFYHNGTPGSERIWSTGGEAKASVHKDHWDLEIKIALGAMNLKTLDNRSLTMQLVRADHSIGAYYAGWVGAGWMDWGGFGEAVFDPSAPTFRFVDRGKIREGDLGLDFEVIGNKHPAPVDLLVRMSDDKGKTLVETTRKVDVAPGQRVPIQVREKVQLPPDVRNSLYILATTPGVDPETGAPTKTVLYENAMPVTALTPKVYEDYIKPWMDRAPQEGQYRWDFSYWPGYGVAQSNIDIDFFGMPEKISSAKAFKVSIFNNKNLKKAITTKSAALKDGVASMVLAPGKLPVGHYVAKMALIGKDGKTVVATQEQQFLRQTYPWEGNKLGTEDIVIAPYTPLEADPNTGILRSVLRSYQLGPDGFFAQVKAGGDGGVEDILSSPIRLEAETPNGPAAITNAKARIVEAKQARIKVESAGSIGNAEITMKNDMEIDGWYDVKMTVKARKPGEVLNRLTLVVPLNKSADTMYIHRYVDGLDAGKDAIPAGDGVVWDSGRLLPMADNREQWGSFVPIVYAGNGDKGIWWFAEENRDWTMSKDLPAVQYVRTKDGVELRINIFAAPTKLTSPRNIHFAFLVDPVKPAIDNRKWVWFKDEKHRYASSITGWRRWGRSTDGYWMEDPDYTALDEFVRGTDAHLDKPRVYPGPTATSYTENLSNMLATGVKKGQPIVLYGSNSNMSEDLPEFQTYAGEWGNALPVDKEVPEAQRGYNMQGSYRSTLERLQGETGVNWVQSQVDCFIWYHKKLVEKTPVNGTWWDNASNFLINDYDPVKKEFYQKWSIFTRRQVTKRLNTIGTQVGREPFWLSNMGADWSWNQMCWHVENGFYVTSATSSLLDQMTVDQFRSLFRIRRGIYHRIEGGYWMSPDFNNTNLRKRSRVQVGLCLLHDIGGAGQDSDRDRDRLPDLLDSLVGFFNENEQCPFYGYWRSGDMVKIDTPKVYCSVYKGNGRAVLVVLNENPDPVDVNFAITDKLLGRKVAKIYDAETNFNFQMLYNDPAGKRGLGEYTPNSFGIEGHGLRLLVVE